MVGGFILPMICGYLFLRLAGSPKRKASAASTFRPMAVLVAGFIVYAGYRGSGQVNLGGIAALVVVVVWAIVQTVRPRPVVTNGTEPFVGLLACRTHPRLNQTLPVPRRAFGTKHPMCRLGRWHRERLARFCGHPKINRDIPSLRRRHCAFEP